MVSPEGADFGKRSAGDQFAFKLHKGADLTIGAGIKRNPTGAVIKHDIVRDIWSGISEEAAHSQDVVPNYQAINRAICSPALGIPRAVPTGDVVDRGAAGLQEFTSNHQSILKNFESIDIPICTRPQSIP